MCEVGVWCKKEEGCRGGVNSTSSKELWSSTFDHSLSLKVGTINNNYRDLTSAEKHINTQKGGTYHIIRIHELDFRLVAAAQGLANDPLRHFFGTSGLGAIQHQQSLGIVGGHGGKLINW